jgi:hypothetical protein
MPLEGLLLMPWTVEHFSRRAFPLSALCLAMVDILAALGVVAAIAVAATAARVNRLLSRK